MNKTNDDISEKHISLRVIFLNLFITLFICFCYFYISSVFGSISTPYISDTVSFPGFGLLLMVFTVLVVLAGPYQGAVAGMIAEALYQAAFLGKIRPEWIIIIGVYGFLSGFYRYKPEKFQKRRNLIILILFLSVATLVSLIIQATVLGWSQIEYYLFFFLQALISSIFIAPIIIFLYDYLLVREERHYYTMMLTHHPPSMSDHTFYLKFGKLNIYFCSRCSGVIIGGMVSFFLADLLKYIYNYEISPELAVLLCVLLPIPGLIDWGTQRLLLRKSDTRLRLMTGFVIGSALHFMSYTSKYQLFMLFLLIFYFTIFGLMMYFGQKKEMRLLKEETQEEIENCC